MTHLIDKDAVVAEIERLRDEALTRQHNLERIGQVSSINEQVAFNLNKVLFFIDTLEEKEVDLEKECSQYFEGWTVQDDLGLTKPDGWSCIVKDLYDIAKHFFELGLKAKEK